MKHIGKILRLSRRLYRQLLGLSVLVLIASMLGQVQPFLVKSIVDDIEAQITSGGGSMERIIVLMAVMVGLNLAGSILNSVNMRFGDYIKSRMRKFLTDAYYGKVFSLPQQYFDGELSGKIINQLIRGISSIQDFLGMMTNFVLPAMFTSVLTIGILFYYNWLIGALALAIFPVYILISHYSTKRWGAREVEKNKLSDVAVGRVQEVIANMRLVRGFGTQRLEWNFISKTMRKYYAIYDKQSTEYHIINFFREFGLELVLMLISLIAFYDAFSQKISIGEMVLILQLLTMLRRPLFAMSFILERIQSAEAGSKEYFEVMDLVSVEDWEEPIDAARKQIHPSIRFEGVGFIYKDTKSEVLKDLSFELPAGETVALVGHSGAGKTTIINLIGKYYEPTKGEIYLGDVPYSTLSHQVVRQHISLVFQESELFSSTIRENVAYGMPEAQDKDIKLALKKANAWDFVQKLEGGLDAEIGERGVKLSGGQKQRIQIARAIMHDTPILILDEATSNLDSKSERLVQEALDTLMQDKLVIVIAHRLSTIQNADRIMVIDGGKLVDMGSPATLAKKKGIYRELLRYQVEGNEKLLKKYDLSG